MPGKIFVNYRRDDVPGDARGVRDGLVAKFGRTRVFMDVDNLLVGQRFDMELAKALDDCDMLVSVIGPRWLDLLKVRTAAGERDYVREEIAEALKRKIAVVPVRVGREGSMHPLPRADELPEDIRDLVLYQKHDVAHERFGRDIAELIAAIVALRKTTAAGIRPTPGVRSTPWRVVGAMTVILLMIGYAGAYYAGVPLPWPDIRGADTAARAKLEEESKTRAEELERLRAAAAKAEMETAKLREDAEVRSKAEAAAKVEQERQQQEAAAAEAKRQVDAAEAKRKADETERQRVAKLAADEKRKREEAEAAARKATAVPKVGETFRDCPDVCPEMVTVPAGEFTMGTPAHEDSRDSSEGPQHAVKITEPFAVGKYEVTFAEYDACASAGECYQVSQADWGRGRQPVIRVTSDGAHRYTAWLSQKTGKSYRILSEAEWEYAARAGTTTPFSTGTTITTDQANFDGNFPYGGSPKGQLRGKTIDVGSFKPNAFGLYDMNGSVCEWVEDCWHDSYNSAPNDGSAWTTSCTDLRNVVRGGAWSARAELLRSGSRFKIGVSNEYNFVGFRVRRTLTP